MDLPLLYTLLWLLLGGCLLWCWSLVTNKVSHVDIFWGPAIALAGLITAIQLAPSWRVWVACGLTSIWALRLAVYLAWRNYGAMEDRRYAVIRAGYSAFRYQSLYVIFGLQACLAWLVSLPLQLASTVTEPAHTLILIDIFGLTLYFVGMFFETVGDYQLARFRAQPNSQGKVLDTGLWRYTRHPNYFGDFCVSWGIAVWCFGSGAAMWSVVGPLIMSVLLIRVSGAGLLESTIGNRRPEYAGYIRRTSGFFPWPPKEDGVNQ